MQLKSSERESGIRSRRKHLYILFSHLTLNKPEVIVAFRIVSVRIFPFSHNNRCKNISFLDILRVPSLQ